MKLAILLLAVCCVVANDVDEDYVNEDAAYVLSSKSVEHVDPNLFTKKAEDVDPKFLSPSGILNAVENETIYIPCHVENMNETVCPDDHLIHSNSDSENVTCITKITIIWFRNGRKIAETEHLHAEEVKSDKFLVGTKTYILTLKNIQRSDSGEYTCRVIGTRIDKFSKQAKLVNVLFSPTIYPDPKTGSLDVELGQPFSLTCNAYGEPRPIMKWYFKNRELLMKNERVNIFNVSEARKDHSGEYHCVADNSIGKPAMAKFIIRILYYPEIAIPKKWIHSARGERTELFCNVSATPSAKVDWFHDNRPINFSSRISTRIYGDQHVLIIKDMKYYDFGNYSCQATNFLGRNIETIEVSGLANPVVFKPDPRIRSETSYTLIWEVESYSPIIQYNLRFRKQQRGDAGGHWIQLIIPAQNSFTSVIHSESYKLSGLEPATVYEAVISSKNEFGWSELSRPFLFATVGANVEEVPQEFDFSTATSTHSTTMIQISDPGNGELQENALWLTDNATKLKVPLITILLTIIFLY